MPVNPDFKPILMQNPPDLLPEDHYLTDDKKWHSHGAQFALDVIALVRPIQAWPVYYDWKKECVDFSPTSS